METKEKNGTAVITDQAGMPNNVIQWATMPYRFEYRRGGYSSFWAWYAALRSALSFLALSRFLIRAKALSIMAVAFSLVAPAKLSHTAVRCASSAVKVDDNLSFWSKARCLSVTDSVAFSGPGECCRTRRAFSFFSKYKYTKALRKIFFDDNLNELEIYCK